MTGSNRSGQADSGRLLQAVANRDVIPAFNAYTFAQVQGVLRAAAAAERVTLLQVSRRAWRHWGDDFLAWLATTHVPAASRGLAYLHLDHGWSDAAVLKAAGLGFRSVMFDGSSLPLDENIRISRELKLQLPEGVILEGEVGVVGRAGLPSTLTEPAEAIEYAQATGVDLMAVSIGTFHGQAAVDVDWSRAAFISGSSKLPLALHGGSGVAPDQLRLAVEAGFRKFNFATALERAANAARRVALLDESDQDSTRHDEAESNAVAAYCAEVYAWLPSRPAFVL